MDKAETLKQIMWNRSKINFEKNESLMNAPLLGNQIKLPVRELLLIYHDIEEKFGFSIPQEEVEKGSFKTYNSILHMIENYAP